MHKNFYKFLDQMLKRKKGDLYQRLADVGYTPAEFSKKSGIDLGNLSHMNAVMYKGSVSFWVKVWRAL